VATTTLINNLIRNYIKGKCLGLVKKKIFGLSGKKRFGCFYFLHHFIKEKKKIVSKIRNNLFN
jgi:hypothetical protein